MKKNNLLDINKLSQQIQTLDKHYVKAYSHCILEVQVKDSQFVMCNCVHAFKAVNLSSYNMILGYFWLQAINLDIN